MKKYIVGIDFGNGETSAWCTPINDNTPNTQSSGSVRLMNANAPGERKIRTAIKLTKDGRFSTTEPGAVLIGLKSKISALDKQKKSAYKAFIKDIYKRIIVNNPHLVDNGNGDSNFYICIASPTKWNEEDQQEYIRFFNNALTEFHQEVLWVINESDAAYFAHRDDNKNVLVVDFGSSTIDYTLISHGMKVSDDKWSNDYLGAREIERAMLESYRTFPNSNFQQAKLATEQVLRQTGNSFYDVRATLEYELRKEKERAYTNYYPNNPRRPYDYKFSYDFYYDTGEIIFDDEQYNFKHKGFFRGENGVCEAYIKAVRDDFAELKDKIKRSGISNIDKIILSGGACIMSWVKEEIINVFGKDVEIIKDDDPEYVVSKGIALYAKAQIKALEDLRRSIQNIPYHSIYEREYIKVRKSATVNIAKQKAEQIVKTISLPTGKKILNAYMDIIQNIDYNNEDFCTSVKKVLNTVVNNEVCNRVKQVIYDAFNYSIDTEDVKVKFVPIVGRFTNDCFESDGFFYKVVKGGIKPWYKPFFDMDESLDATDVSNIVSSVNSKLETDVLDDSFEITVHQLEERVNDIKQQVLQQVDEIFYANQLFKTTFKKSNYTY